MKKILIGVLGLVLILVLVLGVNTNNTYNNESTDILRIHVRANSNSMEDQQVKYKIKDALVDYLIPYLQEVETKQDVKNVVVKQKSNMQAVANNILNKQGFNYKCNIKINNEEFPTRSYDGVVFESGFYDAVIVELGQAVGDNWWCVIYPPICFTSYSKTNNQKVVYKSKIVEIIDKILKRG